MNPSLGVSKACQEDTAEAIAVDLRIVDATKAPRTNGAFRRAITICEAIADMLVIVTSVEVSYHAYYYLALGKHIHYRSITVVATAFGFAVVMVLMLDRAGAYSRGN